MIFLTLFISVLTSLPSHAKTFQNSYISMDLPETWSCIQDGVAWMCTPKDPKTAKEVALVVNARVAGPEDNLSTFLNYLKQPRKLKTRVGTPMPSHVSYAQQRQLAGHTWVQAQHLGSELQDFYTLYLATVKNQLSILISFSAEKDHYKDHNAVFDQILKTLKITATQQLLFAKNAPTTASDVIGIQVAQPALTESLMPPPIEKSSPPYIKIVLLVFLAGLAFLLVFKLWSGRKKITHGKNPKNRPN